MLHLENKRRTVNRKKRIVEEEHDKEKANAQAPWGDPSLRGGMFSIEHRFYSFTIVKNACRRQGDA